MTNAPAATEKEKMLRGEPYYSWDTELVAERTAARALLKTFNATPGRTPASRAIMERFFGSVGRDVVIEAPLQCDYGTNIFLGDNVYMNFNCVLLDVCEIRIGARTMFGPGVQVYTASHPFDPVVRGTMLQDGTPITIEEDVWVGGNAVILPGVRIGRGAVIGAGSVVTKDVPPMCVYAGSPAKFIKKIDG